MLHRRTARPQKRIRPDRSSYKFLESKWGKTHTLWLHVYRIYPPANASFLPSDEALRALLATVPSMRFGKCVRFFDRDYLEVYAPNKNIFTARANAGTRQKRESFLRDLENGCMDHRDLPETVREAADEFMNECGFVNVQWNGHDVTAYTADGKRYEGRTTRSGNLARPFRTFERACNGSFPFFYEAAPP